MLCKDLFLRQLAAVVQEITLHCNSNERDEHLASLRQIYKKKKNSLGHITFFRKNGYMEKFNLKEILA